MRVALPGTAIGFARIARALIVAVALEASGSVAPVMLQEPVDVGNVNLFPLQPIDGADWIWGEGGANTMLFRRRFSSGKEKVRIHVSADNRYTLKLDGRGGEGSELVVAGQSECNHGQGKCTASRRGALTLP